MRYRIPLIRSLRRIGFCAIAVQGVEAQGQCGVPIASFPYNEGFEAAASWTSGGVGDDWAWGTPAHPLINAPGGGAKSWCVGGLTGQFYNNSEESWLMSPCFDFSSLTAPWISFKIFWETERTYDGMVLQYSYDQGSTWDNVGAFGDPEDCLNQNWYNEDNITNLDLASPPHGWSGRIGATQGACTGGFGSGEWVTASHCLTDMAGAPSVRFRFHFGAGYTCNDYDGIAIDDVFIDNAPQPQVDYGIACSGSLASFTASVTGCATTFNWNFGDPASGAQNTATGASASHAFSGPGSYNVTLTASNACGASVTFVENFDVISVEIYAYPETCGAANGWLEAMVTGTNDPVVFDWQPGGGVSQLFDDLVAGTYSVTVTPSSGCPVTATGVVEAVDTGLEVEATHTDVSCFGAADGTATAQVTGGTPNTFEWTPTGGTNAMATGLGPGVYTVSVSDVGGCVVTAEVVISEPAELLLEVDPDVPLCAGSSVVLSTSVTGGTEPYAFTWSPDGPDVSPSSTTTYAVSVVDDNGCTAGPVEITVIVTSAPQPILGVNDSIGCQTHCVEFATGPAGMSSYALDYGDGSAGANTAHCYPRAGDYDVTLTITDADGCTSSVLAPELVHVLPSPIAGFSAPDVVIINDPAVRLIDESDGATTWAWVITGTDTVALSSEPSPAFQPLVVGCYTIEQIVRNDLGCTDTARAQICVEDEFALYAPNAFTPNGDGMNEGFFVVTSVARPSKFELRVFDRWGEVIFTANDPAQFWDGTDLPEGIYAWNLAMRDSEDKIRKASGHVLLLR